MQSLQEGALCVSLLCVNYVLYLLYRGTFCNEIMSMHMYQQLLLLLLPFYYCCYSAGLLNTQSASPDALTVTLNPGMESPGCTPRGIATPALQLHPCPGPEKRSGTGSRGLQKDPISVLSTNDLDVLSSTSKREQHTHRIFFRRNLAMKAWASRLTGAAFRGPQTQTSAQEPPPPVLTGTFFPTETSEREPHSRTRETAGKRRTFSIKN